MMTTTTTLHHRHRVLAVVPSSSSSENTNRRILRKTTITPRATTNASSFPGKKKKEDSSSEDHHEQQDNKNNKSSSWSGWNSATSNASHGERPLSVNRAIRTFAGNAARTVIGRLLETRRIGLPFVPWDDVVPRDKCEAGHEIREFVKQQREEK